PYPDGLAEEWIASHSRNWKERTGLTYAIVEKTSGELIGAIGFVELTDSTGELGYWIGEPYWGNGYCTEAARKLVEFGIQELTLKKIYATYLSSNPASGKVMEKLGMKLVKSFYRPFRGKKRVKIKYYELTVPSSS
ncbi:MAG: N-acetyltransferase, partial [Calditrichaeota bacterium]